MSLVASTPVTLTKLDNADYLDRLAKRVHAEHKRCASALSDAIDANLAIGQCLREARDVLVTDNAYGEWFQAQEVDIINRGERKKLSPWFKKAEAS